MSRARDAGTIRAVPLFAMWFCGFVTAGVLWEDSIPTEAKAAALVSTLVMMIVVALLWR